MPKPDVKFKDQAMRRFLDKLSKRVTKVAKGNSEYADTVSAFVFQNVIEHFQDEEGEDGPWESWSEGYAEQMKREGKGLGTILQDNGRLRNSFKPTNYRAVQDGILWFNDAKTDKGFPYAYAHNNDEAPRKQLPRRSFMWLSQDAMEKIAGVTLNFITKR